MIVPSIDLMNGSAVQLKNGREFTLDAGDPRPLLRTFGRVGEVAVIDLDRAMGQGDNAKLIRELIRDARCRVGGGIRTIEDAMAWLDAGAAKVIIGTKATPEFLGQLPRERTIAAVDAEHGEVVVEGWKTRSGADLISRIGELRTHVGGFLVTFVEREGSMTGLDFEQVDRVIAAANGVPVTIAGGVRSVEEIAELDRRGADAQVGMAIYTGAIDLADALAAPLRSDRADGLWPTVVCDEQEAALGLAYSSPASLREAIATGRGVYFSRSRNEIWRKGAMSGDMQDLLRVDIDCDRDTLRFIVRQHGTGFCHLGHTGCWGDRQGLRRLETALRERRQSAPAGSYTRRLLNNPDLLKAKLIEEAAELATASEVRHVAEEAADLLYFAMVKLAAHDIRLHEVEGILDRRALKVVRRPGDAKNPI